MHYSVNYSKFNTGTIAWLKDQLRSNQIVFDDITDNKIGIVSFIRHYPTFWDEEETEFIIKKLLSAGVRADFSPSGIVHLGNCNVNSI